MKSWATNVWKGCDGDEGNMAFGTETRCEVSREMNDTLEMQPPIAGAIPRTGLKAREREFSSRDIGSQSDLSSMS